MNHTLDTTDLKEIFINEHHAFISKLNGRNSATLIKRREKALMDFAKEGFPTTSNEEWKYTNLSSVLKKDFNINGEVDIENIDVESILLPGLQEGTNTLVFVNGNYSAKHSILQPEDENIEIKNLTEVSSDLLELYFASNNIKEDALTSLNIAFANHGAFIRIGAGKKVKNPIVLYFISDLRNKNEFNQPRNIIIAEENSEVQIIESYHSIGNNVGFVNSVTDIFLKLNSKVDYYRIQREGNNSTNISTTRAIHEDRSNFFSSTITLSGGLVRNNLNILLNSEHSECFLNGLYLIDHLGHVDNHTLVDHAKPNCYSNELYKGVLLGKSVGVFNGKILVREDAQKTNAFQSNKNILLSSEATMNTKPQLEIFADDVKCSHGATVGQLNEEPLFYLRSRGLSEKSAKNLLTLAFAEDIIEKIKIPILRELLKTFIDESLNKK